jgi:nitrite reductase/ring-hydroxylating ferredoxin subunit
VAFQESDVMADFVRVLDASELPDPGKTLVEVDGEMVALFHVQGTWYAIDDVCTHDGGPLADGELRDFRISCPRHGEVRHPHRCGADDAGRAGHASP